MSRFVFDLHDVTYVTHSYRSVTTVTVICGGLNLPRMNGCDLRESANCPNAARDGYFSRRILESKTTTVTKMKNSFSRFFPHWDWSYQAFHVGLGDCLSATDGGGIGGVCNSMPVYQSHGRWPKENLFNKLEINLEQTKPNFWLKQRYLRSKPQLDLGYLATERTKLCATSRTKPCTGERFRVICSWCGREERSLELLVCRIETTSINQVICKIDKRDRTFGDWGAGDGYPEASAFFQNCKT